MKKSLFPSPWPLPPLHSLDVMPIACDEGNSAALTVYNYTIYTLPSKSMETSLLKTLPPPCWRMFLGIRSSSNSTRAATPFLSSPLSLCEEDETTIDAVAEITLGNSVDSMNEKGTPRGAFFVPTWVTA